MKKVMTALLIIAIFVCGCSSQKVEFGNGISGDVVSADIVSDNASANDISDNSVSDDTVSEDAASVNSHDDRVCLVISISENEAEWYEQFTFSRLPDSVQDLEELQEMGLLYFNDPYFSAALEIACFCEYTRDPDNGIAMLEYLNGPEELTDYEIRMFDRQLYGKEYKPFSYFEGATPENYYTPAEPYTVKIFGDKYTWAVEDRVKVFVNNPGSVGARAINVRHDNSDDHWYVYETGLLGEIKAPGPDEIIEEDETVSDNAVSANSADKTLDSVADDKNLDATVSADTVSANEVTE